MRIIYIYIYIYAVIIKCEFYLFIARLYVMSYYELYMIFHAEVTKISRRNCVIKDARIICQSFNTLSPGNQDTPPFVWILWPCPGTHIYIFLGKKIIYKNKSYLNHNLLPFLYWCQNLSNNSRYPAIFSRESIQI